MSVLAGRFDALLFLTATPFQLGRDELAHIVDFFRLARVYVGREQVFNQRVDIMRRAMDDWIDALEGFGAAWRDLDGLSAARCAALITDGAAGGVEADSLELRGQKAFDRCMVAKHQLESGMRPFIVRSVRDREHSEHGAVDETFLCAETRIPLALVDRLLVEVMRSSRTFISSALISACSSWEALLSAAIMRENRGSHTRPVLRQLADRDLLGEHPKVAQTVAQCLAGVEAGEKTLVFVEREQTGRMLRDVLNEKIDDAMPDGSEAPSSAALRQRLQDRARFGWPSLRENYLHTIFPLVFHRDPDRGEVFAAWEEAQTRELWSCVDPASEKRDYVVEKRFWEHTLFTRACADAPDWADGVHERLQASVDNILAPEYILNGLDLQSGVSGECLSVPAAPQRADYRDPRFPFAEAFVGYRSPWIVGRDALAAVWPEDRADFVDAAADAIANSHFRQELAALEIESDPAAHFEAMEGLLLEDTSLWPGRFAALSDEARDAVRTTNQQLAQNRIWSLTDALGSNRRVQYIDGSTKQETQQNAVDGFNTPLYPEVIVTTPVLAEGLDLHRFCRRVIHHDLPWNPAKLEQRTGRVDRVGSLSERLRREHPDGDFKIQVWLPYVPGTYDEFVYERVMARRREFRCLLGSKPEWRNEVLAENEQDVPIDDSLVTRLQVNLGPS